jgi:MobA/MobL family
MAIYHLSASIIKRSAGRSVTAAAAYRAAAKIEDIKTGIVHDYSRKQGVDYSEIISPVSPNSNSSNQWLTNRAELWNKIELIEKRKDAQLAREVTIAIPTELSKPEQIALVREYVQTNYVAAGMIADINLHHLDGDNPHAHILLTMRNLQTSPEGVVEFGLKNTDWNSKELLLAQRKGWEEVANKYLAARGLDTRIDCRSLEEQGSPFIPQIHVGVHAMAMKRKGIATDRGEEFERIEVANNDIRARLEEIYQQEYTEPEPEHLIPDLNAEKESILEKQDYELGRLVHEMIPLNCKNSLKFGEYRIQRGYEDYIQVSTNRYGTKILELTRENDRWNTNILDPNTSKNTTKYYSPDYISELVNDFEKCVRYPTELQSKEFSNEIKHKYDPELPQIKYVDQGALFRKEMEETKALEDIISDHHWKYWIARDEAKTQIQKYSSLINSDSNHQCQKYELEFLNRTKNNLYELSTHINRNYLPRAGDTINNENKIVQKRFSYNTYRSIFTDISEERQATTEDKHIEFQKRIDGLSTQTLWMKNLTAEIESEIIKVRTHTEIESTRQKAKAAEKAVTIKIESLSLTQQPKVTRPRPPDRTPISEGDPRVHLRAMANKTHQPTIDLIKNQDLTIETLPIIQKPEATIFKLPILSEVAVQIEQQQLEHETTEKQRLTSLPENKQVIGKSQAKRKSNRGFER